MVDEAHHTAADSYRGILDALGAGSPGCETAAAGIDHAHERAATPDEVSAGCELGYTVTPCPGPMPGPLLLGVTATPDRGDGKGLDDLFDEIVASYDILWGIRSGFLSDLRGVRVTVGGLDLAGVKTRHGDFDQGQTGRLMEEAHADVQVVRAWQEHAAGRRTLVFTPTVEMAARVAEAFTAAGVRAGWVAGSTPLDERRATLAAYSRGDLDVIANCAVLTEGYDEPRTDCVIVARPTKSRALYTQMVGRGTRRHPDKADCLVLDVVGATAMHSLVTVPSLFGLEEERAERMGDGTGNLAAVVQERDDELVRLGKLRAEDAELFGRVRADGVAWVPVHGDGELRRYIRALGKTDDGAYLPTVVLAQRQPDADVWTAGLLAHDGGKRVLLADVPLEMAQGVAEDYVRRHGRARITQADAAWRKQKPSPRALAAAKKWRMKVDPAWTAGELSEQLDVHIARVKARR